MRIVAIGGIPGTGKTTLMKKLMQSELPALKEFRKLVKGHEYDDFIVLGDYSNPENIFGGTDTFSMAVQPEAEKFFDETQKNVIFEGDRIFNSKMLEYVAKNHELLVLVLEADMNVIKKRYEERGSDQSDKFINGRKTKYDNIKKNDNLSVYVAEHTNPDETEVIVEGINEFLKTGEIVFEKFETDNLLDLFS